MRLILCVRRIQAVVLTIVCSCRTDYVLTQDKSFKKWAKAYAQDQDLFFKE